MLQTSNHRLNGSVRRGWHARNALPKAADKDASSIGRQLPWNLENMPAEWSTFFAVICLFALAFFLYRWLRRSSRPREREFNSTLTSAPLIIGKAKWDMLTPRQQQVARLAARGLSNSEIAQQLDIKPNTVDAHLKKIYASLDVHSRAELSYRIKDHID